MTQWQKITIGQLSQSQQQKFWQIAQNIRCPSCRAQSILESGAAESVELREKLMQLLRDDTQEETIVAIMQQEVGVENVTVVSQSLEMAFWCWPIIAMLLYVGYLLLSKKGDKESVVATN